MATSRDLPAKVEPLRSEAKRARAVALVLPRAGVLPLSAPLAYAAALSAGILYWLAFPKIDAWPLTFVAWVPLILAMHRQPAGRAARLGWVAGVTMNVAGFFWLQKMLVTFAGFSAPVCFLFVLIVCGYQGLRIGVLGWLYGRATARGWPWAPVFAGAFVASELVFPLLFPWYYAGTVHTLPLLAQTADLGGPIAVGLVLVAANVSIAEALIAGAERRRIAPAPIATGAAALAVALVYGAIRVRAVDAAAAAAPEATVGIAQANMGLLEKRRQFEEGIERHLRLSHELRARGADFLVWSETSAMHAVRDESYRAELRGLAARIGLPTIFGSVIVKEVPDEREYVLYNSAVASEANGAVDSRYDKEYLLTFGEYLPFGETFPILYRWSPNSGHFSPGTSLDPLWIDSRGEKHPVTALICYEDILPRYTNDAVRHAKPELLVNLTNDAWFLDTAAPWQHFALAQMRAIEHRRYYVRGTNSGVSGVVDPVGRVVVQSGTFREEALSAKIHWMSSRTVYEALGDWPWTFVAFVSAAAALRRRAPVRAASPS